MDARELAAAIAGRLSTSPDAVEPVAASGLAAIAARWPAAPIDARFADHVIDRIARHADPAALLARLPFDDLFLAWWAGGGAADGIAAFEATHGAELLRIASRFPGLPRDELLQHLRIKLFVGPPPAILDYAGAGPLLAWVRVVAVRSFVDLVRAARSRRYDEELDEAELLGLPAGGKRQLGDALGSALKKAFADAVARLAPRQRAFLRHAYVDRLTLDQIASTYCIHRATVARTLASARDQLIAQTRAGVVAALGVAPTDLASAIGTLGNQLELSLSRVLGPASEDR